MSRIPPEKLEEIIDKELYSDTGNEKELERVEKHLVDIDQQLGRIRTAYAKGSYTLEDYEIEKDRIEGERGKLAEEQQRLDAQLEPDAYELSLMEGGLYNWASLFDDPAN